MRCIRNHEDHEEFAHQRVVPDVVFFVRFVVLLLLVLPTSCGKQPATGVLPPITASGVQLLAGGRAIEVRGINYVHTTTANLQVCPQIQFGADPDCPWEIAQVAADLDRLQRLGVNTIRIFLNYYVFGGAREADPAYDLAPALTHLDALIAEANWRGMYVLPVLLQKYPQDRFGPANYATALDLHVRPVVQHLAGRPGLLAWDLFNEPDIGSPVDIRCWDWDNANFPLCFPLAQERLRFIQVIHGEVKRLDPARLTTVGLAFAKSHVEPHDAGLRVADMVDLFTFHYYDNEPKESGRYAQHWYYGQGFPTDLQRAIDELQALGLNKPIVITELGFPTGPGLTRTADDLRRDLHTALQLTRDERLGGIMLWQFQPTPEATLADLFARR